MESNKTVLNISKTKYILFGTNHSLKHQLNLEMNVKIEQFKETKLFGVTLDCKLSRSKHIDATVAKVGRGLFIMKSNSLVTTLSTRQVLQALSCLSKLLAHSSDTHAYPTRHATRGLFTVPKSRTDYGRHTVPHRAMTTWNSIPHQVTDASSKI